MTTRLIDVLTGTCLQQCTQAINSLGTVQCNPGLRDEHGTTLVLQAFASLVGSAAEVAGKDGNSESEGVAARDTVLKLLDWVLASAKTAADGYAGAVGEVVRACAHDVHQAVLDGEPKVALENAKKIAWTAVSKYVQSYAEKKRPKPVDRTPLAILLLGCAAVLAYNAN